MNNLRFTFAYPTMEKHSQLRVHTVTLAEVRNVTTPHGESGGTAVLGELVMNNSETVSGNEVLSQAVAVCSPRDQYSFEVGCKKVVERLLENISLHPRPPKRYRKVMWTSYFDAMERYRSQV